MEPGMSGTQFLTKVKERYPHVITMILSAYADSDYVLDALNEAGAYQYLIKPWQPRDFIHKVTQALQFYHSESERRRFAEANQRLLKKMAFLDTFSLLGTFSQSLHDRFFPFLRKLIKEGRLGQDSPLFADRDQYLAWAAIIKQLGRLDVWTTDDQKGLQFVEGDITSLVRDCVSEAKETAEKTAKEVEFVGIYEKDLPKLLVHSALLSVPVKAVIENAVIFNKNPKKKVTIRTKRVKKEDRDLVVIEVEDNGPGIDPKMREKIFSPLVSGHPQEVSDFAMMREHGEYNFGQKDHIGLGLSVAQWCVAHHDGTIEFKSEPGKGSIFTITIPTDQADLRQQLGLG